MWNVRPEVDRATAYAVLTRDPIANAYALVDLEPPYGGCTSVAVASCDGREPAACLVVRCAAFTGVVTHGPVDGVEAVLDRVDLPRHTHLDIPAAHRLLVERWLTFTDPHERQLMAVTPQRFRMPPESTPAPVRLGPADLENLVELYAGYEGSAFHREQLEYGVYFGVRENGHLVAAGGTPGLALASGAAIVTSVFTRPEVRRRGFGAAATGAVTAELFSLGCRHVSLDVEVDNLVARRIYTRLGYQDHSIRWQGAAVHR